MLANSEIDAQLRLRETDQLLILSDSFEDRGKTKITQLGDCDSVTPATSLSFGLITNTLELEEVSNGSVCAHSAPYRA